MCMHHNIVFFFTLLMYICTKVYSSSNYKQLKMCPIFIVLITSLSLFQGTIALTANQLDFIAHISTNSKYCLTILIDPSKNDAAFVTENSDNPILTMTSNAVLNTAAIATFLGQQTTCVNAFGTFQPGESAKLKQLKSYLVKSAHKTLYFFVDSIDNVDVAAFTEDFLLIRSPNSNYFKII